MTPEHPRWREFCEKLGGPGYCNFHELIPGDIKSTTWDCDNSGNRPYARRLLAEMGEFDIEESLRYMNQHGGHCDCEILFNVDPGDDDFDEEEEDDEPSNGDEE